MDDNKYKLILGQKIKHIRNSMNLTQETFSELINLEIPNLSKIENGKSYPSMPTLRNIINACKIEPNDLFDTSFYDNPEMVQELAFEYYNRLPFSKQVMFLKMLMLINDEDKN